METCRSRMWLTSGCGGMPTRCRPWRRAPGSIVGVVARRHAIAAMPAVSAGLPRSPRCAPSRGRGSGVPTRPAALCRTLGEVWRMWLCKIFAPADVFRHLPSLPYTPSSVDGPPTVANTKSPQNCAEQNRIRTNFVRSIFGSTRGRVHESNSRHVVHPSTVLTAETQSRTVLGWCSSLRREPGRGSKRAICLLWVQRLA